MRETVNSPDLELAIFIPTAIHSNKSAPNGFPNPWEFLTPRFSGATPRPGGATTEQNNKQFTTGLKCPWTVLTVPSV